MAARIEGTVSLAVTDENTGRKVAEMSVEEVTVESGSLFVFRGVRVGRERLTLTVGFSQPPERTDRGANAALN